MEFQVIKVVSGIEVLHNTNSGAWLVEYAVLGQRCAVLFLNGEVFVQSERRCCRHWDDIKAVLEQLLQQGYPLAAFIEAANRYLHDAMWH